MNIVQDRRNYLQELLLDAINGGIWSEHPLNLRVRSGFELLQPAHAVWAPEHLYAKFA